MSNEWGISPTLPWAWSHALSLKNQPNTRVLQAQQSVLGRRGFQTCIHSCRAVWKCTSKLHRHHRFHSGHQLMAWEWWPQVTLDTCKSLEKAHVPLVAPATPFGISQVFFLWSGPTTQGCCHKPIWKDCSLHPTKYSEWIIHYNVTEFFHNHRTWHPGF